MGKYNFNLRERLHQGIYKTRKLVKFTSFKSLAGLVILMLGLISGIYLVQQRQIIMKKATEMDKQLNEDLIFAKRTEDAWKRYEKGKFKSMDFDKFIEEMKKW